MSRATRGEWLALAGAVAFGADLRLHRITEIGLSHFDEGIYALSGLWPWTGAFVPDQGFYSPPVYPVLIGLTGLVLGGPSDLSPLFVSAMSGIGSIVLGWAVGRRWWGPGEGLVAAWLIAASGFQIALSRIGLTDATFTFLFLLSLVGLEMGIEKGGWWRLVLAGLVVGSTWNTKYNGFLPLVLALGFCSGPLAFVKLRRLAFMSILGCLAYLPWALTFHVEHGYETLVSHQAGYWRGFAGLWEGWPKALVGIGSLRMPWLAATLFVAIAVRARWAPSALIIGLGGSVLALAPSGEVLLVGLAALALISWPPEPGRLAATWMLGWLLVLPALYTPYTRLWLPTMAIVLIFAAAAWWRLAGALARHYPFPSRGPWAILSSTAGLGTLFVAARWLGVHSLPEATGGYRQAVAAIVELCRSANLVPMALARPPLFFYMAVGNSGGSVPARRLDSNVAELPTPRPGELLIVDPGIPYSGKLPESGTTRAIADGKLFHVEPSAITWLDEHGRWQPADERTQTLLLFEAPR